MLIDEFVEEISVLPDYLDVKVHGAPPLHVRYQEVGMKESGSGRVGGGTPTAFLGFQPCPLDRVQGRTSCLCCAHNIDRRSLKPRHSTIGRTKAASEHVHLKPLALFPFCPV